MKIGESGKSVRVHDLVFLSPGVATIIAESAIKNGQSWVSDALEGEPWAVVRRVSAESADDVAVGIRGESREQRWAVTVPRSEILGVISPQETLICRPVQPEKPAFRALEEIQRWGLPVEFGPGGSVGFELATGRPAVKDSSDLDLVLFAPDSLNDEVVLAIDSKVKEVGLKANVHIDVLIETRVGGVALAELRRAVGTHSKPKLAVRTADGPFLVEDPWKELD